MKNSKKIIGLVLALSLLLALNVFADETVGSAAVLDEGDYSLEDMLEYALEDEIMAQAEYALIIEMFDMDRPFSNILRAEIKHQEAVIGLYESRGWDLPNFDADDHLYIPESIDEIFEVGVQAEIKNIAMYDTFLEEELPEDVRLVFESLKAGSENHLAAFERGTSRGGSNGGQNRGNSRGGRRNR